MKKILISLAIVPALILLLGLAKSDSKLQVSGSRHPTFESWHESCTGSSYNSWQKIKEYRIIRAPELDKLQTDVNDKLDHGWHLMGEISQFDNNYCQVMVQ